LLSLQTSNRDPLAIALRRKALTGCRGATQGTSVAEGEGWRVVDVVCTSGPHDRPFEEHSSSASISLVLSGTFVYKSDCGSSLLSAGSLLLGNADQAFECSHEHGEGDRCLSFQFDRELLERLGSDAGASSVLFTRHGLPPLRALAPLTARARMAMGAHESFEEIALELAGTVIRLVGHPRRDASAASMRHPARIARVLRLLELRTFEPHTLLALAQRAGLSRYHFLRTFKEVTGVTPHQWILRARLRSAAERLVDTRDPVTQIALDVGFEDLSNFIRTFRAEFGVSPTRYRARA
jgi:AraC-like DNA-binding protein